VSIAVGVDTNLHDACIPELVEGGVEHGGDESSAAWAEGFIVELHKNRGVVNTNDDGVRDVVTYDIAGNKETTGGEEYEGGEVDDNHARCTRPLF